MRALLIACATTVAGCAALLGADFDDARARDPGADGVPAADARAPESGRDASLEVGPADAAGPVEDGADARADAPPARATGTTACMTEVCVAGCQERQTGCPASCEECPAVAGAVSTCTPAGICGHVCLVDHAPCAAGCCPRTEARSVAISQAAACSVDAAGAVHCAGDNFTGLLGLPPRVVTGVVAVSGLPPARKVVVGDAYACALTHPGDVYCWGDGHRPSTGQQQALDRTLRHRLGFEGMVDLFGGSKGACALRPNGDLHCWGRLGDAGDQPRLVARGVRGGAVGGTDLAGQHLCIVGVRGDLRCMGNNDHRQLGSSDPLARGPIVPHGLDRDVIAVVAGHRHTCALVGTDEPSKTRTLCWGFHAALGSIDESRSAVHPTPTPVAGDHSFIALGAGGHHTCGLSADGSVRCWGSRPQLSFHETPAFIGGLSDVLSITSGNDTTCARTASDLRCFGRGYARTHQPSVDPLP